MNARGYLHFMPNAMDEMLELGTWNMPVSGYLYYGGVKSFADGSIQSLTAVLGEPYACKPDFCGDHVLTPEQIAELIAKYHCQGVPVAFHANGDAAIEFVVRGFEEALRKCPRKVPGDMIIHVQMATDEQLSRLHACGVTPTFFVRHVNVWGERHVNLFLGEERAARLDPCGSCVRMGIPFGLHVDSPVQPVDAIRSIHTAVNRTTTAGRPSSALIEDLAARRPQSLHRQCRQVQRTGSCRRYNRSRILCGFCAAFRKSADRAARVHRNAFRAQDHLRRAHRLRILRSSPRLPAVHAKAGSLFSPSRVCLPSPFWECFLCRSSFMFYFSYDGLQRHQSSKGPFHSIPPHLVVQC